MKYDCLIIDDETELADNTAEYFNMFDVKTKAVYSSAEADLFLKSNEPSLVLLDINLSDGSGFEFCRKIRQTMNIPILFISARNTDDDKIIALNIGGDDYITKDSVNKTVFVNGEEKKITSIEWKLLDYLIANRNRLVTKTEIFDNVWNDRFTTDGTLNVHVRKIREAIEKDPQDPKYIVTVWKEGYKFVSEESR